MELALAVVLFVVVLAAGVAALVATLRRGQLRANEVVPGLPSSAPPSWAGAHTVEARLHRRLRDGVRALHAQTGAGVPTEQRLALEQAAVDIDDRLVAVAALPERLRAEHLATAEAAVTALEDAVGLLLTRAVEDASDNARSQVAQVAERLRLLEEARAELDAAVPRIPRPTDPPGEVRRAPGSGP